MKVDWSINETKQIHPAEHEVWFNFNNDSDAELFLDWWYEYGQEKFSKYKEKNKDT